LSLQGERGAEEWGEEYQRERPTFDAYTAALKVLLPQLLDKAGIAYVQVEGRTKEVANFVSKLRRKQEKYTDPLKEVTDLAGLRVVLYYIDDVERVGQIVQEQFTVDMSHSVDKGALMDPDRFGYLSVHHIVQPSSTRRSLPEWAAFSDLYAEIQVRTVLQHSWGAISRKLAYASVREAPRDLQRSLNRLSALLELADEEFLDIRQAREGIEQQYDREVERGNLDLAVDESSLEIYLRESGVNARIAQMAEDAGSPSEEVKEEFYGENEDLIEEQRQQEGRALLKVLDDLGITRISELDARLQGLWDAIPGFMKAVNSGYTDLDDRPISTLPRNWLTLILLWAAEAPTEKFSDLNYVDRLIELVMSLSPPAQV
jgi:ppGpp synthetase/RelA/SpoT-type nucleotidyltranferase